MSVIIRDLLPQPRLVPLGGDKNIGVRGISLTQTIALLDRYKDPLSAFFGSSDLDFTLLVAQAPDMVAEIIAMGVDAVGQEEDIKQMSLQQQTDILMEVWDQSVPNVKKLQESLAKATASLKVAQENTPQLLNTFSPPSSTNSLEVGIDSMK